MAISGISKCEKCGLLHSKSTSCDGHDLASARRLRVALRAAGVSGAELARRCEVHENTVTNWRNGHTAAPGAVFAYLELLAKLKEIVGADRQT